MLHYIHICFSSTILDFCHDSVKYRVWCEAEAMALAVRITGALIPPFSLYSFEGNFPAEQYECMTTPRDISPCRRVQIYATVREWTQCQSAWKLFSNFAKRTSPWFAVEQEEMRAAQKREVPRTIFSRGSEGRVSLKIHSLHSRTLSN